MEIPLLTDITIILGLSVFVILVFQRLRVPSIIGFLLTGIIAGPHVLKLITAVHEIEMLAELGVIMLLFIIGLEFSLASLSNIKRSVFIAGGLQVILTIGVVYLLATAFNIPGNQALFIGFLFSLSSTAIVLKLLQSRSEMDSPQGKTTLAILIFQDIMVVPMMLITPMLAGSEGDVLVSLALLAVKGLGVVALVILSARYIVPKLLHLIASSRSKELFILSIVVICFAVAWLTSSIGLSLALGAFLAGLIISESEYSHQAISNILPFHEIFTSIFFVSIGMLLDVQFLLDHFLLILSLASFTLVLKAILASLAALALNLPLRTAIVTGLMVCQVGEFAFILSGVGIENGIISNEIYQYFLSVSIVTMGATPFVINISHPVSAALARIPLATGLRKYIRKRRLVLLPDKDKRYYDHLVIIGFGLNGKNLAMAAKAAGINYLILDMNAERVRQLKNEEPIHFGDAVHAGVLKHLWVNEARVVVIAISDPVSTRRTVQNVRSLSSKVYIIVRTRYINEVEQLKSLGADEVIPEEFETSVEIFTRVLMKYLVPKDEIDGFITQVRSDGYEMFRGISSGSSQLHELEHHLSETEIATVRIKVGSVLRQRSIEESSIRTRFGVTILALKKQGEMITNPGAGSVIDEGDVLYTFGKPPDIAAFFEFANRTDHEAVD
jgi:monovalent cation:H+ antiporter-2, CPA2 family